MAIISGNIDIKLNDLLTRSILFLHLSSLIRSLFFYLPILKQLIMKNLSFLLVLGFVLQGPFLLLKM